MLPELIDGVEKENIDQLLGDSAYDSDPLRAWLWSFGIVSIIPGRRNRLVEVAYDKEAYKGRHVAENVFVDAKHFRGIFTRYQKLASSYGGLLCVVFWCIGTRKTRRGASPYHLDSPEETAKNSRTTKRETMLQLEERVTALEDKMGPLTEAVIHITEVVNGHTEQLTRIEGRLDSVDRRIGQLEARVDVRMERIEVLLASVATHLGIDLEEDGNG